MGKMYEILLAGFGGQGILFAGKTLSYAGMKNGKNISWIPSYGPEMRGGTCNCGVVVSDNIIGCPIVTAPNILIAMNTPSFEKFEGAVASGGLIIADSSMILSDTKRNDVKVVKIPATQMAKDNGVPKLANMIIIGKLLKETHIFELEFFKKAMAAVIPSSKKDMLEDNLIAVEMGYKY
jgi:2-oxoglutarate ferredoxin oxidoreductase subunit gamma